jgi:hypothetical protein
VPFEVVALTSVDLEVPGLNKLVEMQAVTLPALAALLAAATTVKGSFPVLADPVYFRRWPANAMAVLSSALICVLGVVWRELIQLPSVAMVVINAVEVALVAKPFAPQLLPLPSVPACP